MKTTVKAMAIHMNTRTQVTMVLQQQQSVILAASQSFSSA
jgi:hypothetical protein